MADPMRSRDVKQLVAALMLLETEEECTRFLSDIGTMNEVQSWAQRLEVARLLKQGLTYTHVEQMTGASTATISRVKRFLQYGAGGYELVLQRLPEPEHE